MVKIEQFRRELALVLSVKITASLTHLCMFLCVNEAFTYRMRLLH